MYELLFERLAFSDYFKDPLANAVHFGLSVANSGLRPSIPDDIIDEYVLDYVQLMQECWRHDPKKRPDSAMVHKRLLAIQEMLYDDNNEYSQI
jgi:hypothetical protein